MLKFKIQKKNFEKSQKKIPTLKVKKILAGYPAAPLIFKFNIDKNEGIFHQIWTYRAWIMVFKRKMSNLESKYLVDLPKFKIQKKKMFEKSRKNFQVSK